MMDLLSSSSDSSLLAATANSKKRPWTGQRRDVVSEEEYTSTLSSIIQRDYYSDLPDLERQLAVLERRSQGDVPGAVQVRRAARRLQQHEDVLTDMERDQEADVMVDGMRRVPRPLHRETVTGFHARVTSEDNNEFDATQRQEIQENRKRLEEMFLPSHLVNRLKQSAENADDDDDDDDDKLASDEYDAPLNRIDYKQWKQPEARSSLFFVPCPADASNNQTNKPPLLTNGSGSGQNNTETTHDAAMRTLMPPPPPKEMKKQQAAIVKIVSSANDTDNPNMVSPQALVEYIPKHCMEKRIEPSQTRFPRPQQLAVSLVPPDTRRSSLDSEYSTDASTDLDSDSFAGRPIHLERVAHEKRQRRDLETFVNMTPVVIPGRGRDEVEASPIVTWGTVAGTPLLIRRVDGPCETLENSLQQSSFSVPDECAREKAAQKALATLEERKHKAQRSNNSHSQSLSRRRDTDLASFSPAAMSLLAKTSSKLLGAASSARSAGALRSALRASSQLRQSQNRSVASSSSSRSHSYHQATPQISAAGGSGSSNTKASTSKSRGPTKGTKSMTDGLLQLH